jgi:hypothetical protein
MFGDAARGLQVPPGSRLEKRFAERVRQAACTGRPMRQHSALDPLPGGNASRLGLAAELRRSSPAPAGLLLRGAFLGLVVYFFGHLDARRDSKCSTAILDRPLIAMALLRAGHQLAKRGGRVFRFGGKLSPQHIAEHSVRHPTALMPPKRPIEYCVNISPHPMPSRPRRVQSCRGAPHCSFCARRWPSTDADSGAAIDRTSS